MRCWLIAAVFISSFAFGTIPASAAQVAAGRPVVRGRVLDSSGAPIAAARVTAVPDGQRAGTSTLTDERGEFALALDAGPYTIAVAAQGFQELSQEFTAAQGGGESREFVLQVAGPRETLTVNAPPPYQVPAIMSATKTLTPLRDVPQSVTVVTHELIKDQMMMSLADVVRYVPGISSHQGENNRDQVIIRGNNSSADFYVNGVRDDVQYYRDLYNIERVEALKGSNAMIFGRGGVGGVVNRVTKEAGFRSFSEITLQAGSFDNRRFTADFNQPLGERVALRVNGLYEHSDSFRTAVGLERSGISPTVTFVPSSRTTLIFAYEHLRDTRVADRGISSFQGRPADVDISTYYGTPSDSHVGAYVHMSSVTLEHRTKTDVMIRNHTLIGDYDRWYQNYVPGAVTADKSQMALTAYNNATKRLNVFNQTDVTYGLTTGRFQHTLLAGLEVGRQSTDNFRNTGFFNDTATSILVPYAGGGVIPPVTFRQSATDADNHLLNYVVATYAQDQVQVTRTVQVIAGLRFDRFDLEYHNNRNGDTLERPDNLLSPRVGIVFKPSTPVSFYTSYSVSYLPSSGDQFSSLTTITQQVEPEKISNYEIGAKWDVRPDLSLTTAVYRLDRMNTRSTDPNNPTRIVQTGSQTTNGYELGANGRITSAWGIAGGYAFQDAFVARATTAAVAGATVGQVPRHTFSLWNNYRLHPRVAGGLGVIYRSDMFVAVDNAVTVPGYMRADAAVFLSLSKDLRLQVNVENVFNTTYYVNADSNTNISPGFPRAVRVGLTAVF